MKLRGISEKGMKRLAQVIEEPPYSGSRELLLDNTVSRLIDEVGEEITPDAVQEWCNTTNNNPNGEQLLSRQLVRQWGFPSEVADKILDVLAWSAHEMLDYDYADERKSL